jgi:hypothetical protein
VLRKKAEGGDRARNKTNPDLKFLAECLCWREATFRTELFLKEREGGKIEQMEGNSSRKGRGRW